MKGSLEFDKMTITDLESQIEDLSGIADELYQQGEYSAASEQIQKALQICEEAWPADPNDANILDLKENLAQNYYHLGRFKDAEKLDREVLEARESTLDADDEDTIFSRERLAKDNAALGNHDNAVDLIQKNLHIQEEKPGYGRGHADTIESRYYLATQLHAVGKYQQALDLHKINLPICEEVFNPNHKCLLKIQREIITLEETLKCSVKQAAEGDGLNGESDKASNGCSDSRTPIQPPREELLLPATTATPLQPRQERWKAKVGDKSDLRVSSVPPYNSRKAEQQPGDITEQAQKQETPLFRSISLPQLTQSFDAKAMPQKETKEPRRNSFQPDASTEDQETSDNCKLTGIIVCSSKKSQDSFVKDRDPLKARSLSSQAGMSNENRQGDHELTCNPLPNMDALGLETRFDVQQQPKIRRSRSLPDNMSKSRGCTKNTDVVDIDFEVRKVSSRNSRKSQADLVELFDTQSGEDK
jgi:tetratricopeptide (TPR) repeat protein